MQMLLKPQRFGSWFIFRHEAKGGQEPNLFVPLVELVSGLVLFICRRERDYEVSSCLSVYRYAFMLAVMLCGDLLCMPVLI